MKKLLKRLKALIQLSQMQQHAHERDELEQRLRNAEAFADYYDEAQQWHEPATSPNEWGERFSNIRNEHKQSEQPVNIEEN